MHRANELPPSNPEIWGGLECTINRTGDRWHDQLATVGHYDRHSDVDLLAELGIKAMRYPVLWEHHQPHRQSTIDWAWTDHQLSAIREHDITPIAGLVHHGSGPGFTDLLSPGFADDLASYAARVAARFPWLEYYTPVNEPLTTARFSGLYGIWYPHHTDPLSFARMLLNQLEGVVKAMKAIRLVNPAARLVQTEDLAKTHSTPGLAYQADFENHRRWLTFDILSGRLDNTHPLWDYFLFIGIQESELTFFIRNRCLPDILGLNYYITSERFLDENLEPYGPAIHGGNGRHVYADTEAVRAIIPDGLSSLLMEAWERYKLPIAVTEAHLQCTREEQMRWLKEVWDVACRARQSGIDIRAVTAWALLGANDWDSLLTRQDGHYEPGAFELNHGQPVITAVGHLIRSLAKTGHCNHPVLEQAGWWHRHPPADVARAAAPLRSFSQDDCLLIVGATNPQVRALSNACIDRGILFHHTSGLSEDEAEKVLRFCWGVITVEVSVQQKAMLSAACESALITFSDLNTGDDVRDFLNVIIDHSMAQYAGEPLGKLTQSICF